MKQLHSVVVAAGLAAFAGGPVAVWPQVVGAQAIEGGVWIQIEAKNSRPRIEDRLQFWSEALPNATAFAMASGWYAVAIGPYSREEADLVLQDLRISGAIPSDSYIVQPRIYRTQLPKAVAPAPVAAPPATTSVTAPLAAPVVAPTTPPVTSPEASPLAPAAQAPVATAPAVAPAPIESLAEARAAEAALPREDRMEIQRALAWAGVYTSGIDGAFGPGTRAAIAQWQTRSGLEATGVLRSAERAALMGSWKAEVTELGLESIRDEEAGIELQMPMGLVQFDAYHPPFARYVAKGGSGMQIWLISQPGDAQALQDLYARLQTMASLPQEGPRGLRARGFDIEGRDSTYESYAWAELSQGVIKGYLVTGPRADGPRTARVERGLRQSFTPIAGQVLDPGLVPLDERAHAAMMGGVEKRAPRRAGSGFFIDTSGSVMTAASLVQSCGRITLDGGVEAQLQKTDAGAGVAVLRPVQVLAPKGYAAFATGLPLNGSEIAVTGYSFGADLPLPSTSFGRFEAPTALDGSAERGRLTLGAMAGDLGGAVLNDAGRVIGVLKQVPTDPQRLLPESVSYLAPTSAVLAELAPQLRPATDQALRLALEDLSSIGQNMAVQVLCW